LYIPQPKYFLLEYLADFLSGTKVLKCREGLNNKAYILTMDNGSEVFAKLSNPIAGPAFYTTASEVATREFVSSILDPYSAQLK
jgi:hypothetical protein